MLVVDREDYILSVYQRPLLSNKFQVTHDYDISVGMDGVRTPRGLYLITAKAKNPDWTIPDSDWARDLGLTPGTTVSGDDPHNPIVSRWMEFWDGAGIHGTYDTESLGRDASHGCIRLRVEDVEEVYEFVRRGTPIYIV